MVLLRRLSVSCSAMTRSLCCSFFFFFNDTATTEIYTLSLHDALPIYVARGRADRRIHPDEPGGPAVYRQADRTRSEEHTSELQSPCNLVCRLLLEKKKKVAYSTSCARTTIPHYH